MPDGTQRIRSGLCPKHYGAARTDGRTCREEECGKQAKASRGWCWGHYERWRKYGDPHAPVHWHSQETDEEWVAKYVEPDGDCWLWTSHVAANGYGKTSSDWAHREVFARMVGPIPAGMTLDHLCRVRRCVNPDHLEPVTLAENLRRSPLVGRNSHPREVCKNGHPRTPENTYHRPDGVRECRDCIQARRTAHP